MAALSSLRTASASCVRPRLAARAAVPRPAFTQVLLTIYCTCLPLASPCWCSQPFCQRSLQAKRSTVALRAQQDYETTTAPEVDKLVKDLQDKVRASQQKHYSTTDSLC